MAETFTQIPDHLEHVGAGWHPLLMRLHDQLTTVAPQYLVGQVKEKYGELRVYLDHTSDDPAAQEQAWQLVEDAEGASRSICEFCGAPGSARNGGWVKTMCDRCHGQ